MNRLAVSLLDIQNRTISGDGDVFDLWGSGFEGSMDVVLISEPSGDPAGSTVFKLQTSAINNGNWEDAITFHTVPNASVNQTIPIAVDHCKRYVKMNYTVSGTFNGYSLSFFMGERKLSRQGDNLFEKGATIFSFNFTPDSQNEIIALSDATDGRVTAMDNANWAVVVSPSDGVVSDKTKESFVFNGTPGVMYEFTVTGGE